MATRNLFPWPPGPHLGALGLRFVFDAPLSPPVDFGPFRALGGLFFHPLDLSLLTQVVWRFKYTQLRIETAFSELLAAIQVRWCSVNGHANQINKNNSKNIA